MTSRISGRPPLPTTDQQSSHPQPHRLYSLVSIISTNHDRNIGTPFIAHIFFVDICSHTQHVSTASSSPLLIACVTTVLLFSPRQLREFTPAIDTALITSAHGFYISTAHVGTGALCREELEQECNLNLPSQPQNARQVYVTL